jgi:glyoxylase I family protein
LGQIAVTRMHHVSVLVADLARSLEFYCGLLGLAMSPKRPAMSYAGAWLEVGDAQIHLLVLPSPDPASGRPAHAGRDRHLALCVTGLDTLREELSARGIPYTVSGSGRRALFCRDPDGNGVELVEESAAA